MGKRAKEGPHRNRHEAEEDDDDEIVEEHAEQDPLGPDQISNIQSRKKLVAKRRVGSTADSGSVFGSNPTPFSFLPKPAESISTEDKPAASVFTGFKGFSAFKSSSTTVTPTPAPTPTPTPAPTPQTQPAPKAVTTTTPIETQNSTNNKQSLINKNISESELKFISELSELYERCYGSNKRNYKLPIDALNENSLGDADSSDQETKYACLLAELNKHCSKWISKHVEESPLVILTPVFVDYFNYLILLEKHFFPSTFSKKSDAIETPATTTTTIASSTSKTPTMFNSLFNGAKPTPLLNGASTNGYKEKENGAKKQDKMDESDKTIENENDIYETSKTFPSLVKTQTQPFAPISLASNTPESTSSKNFNFGSTLSSDKPANNMFFKPPSTDVKSTINESAKKQTESPAISASLSSNTLGSSFKFGSNLSTPVQSVEQAPEKTFGAQEPKKDMFASSVDLTTPKSNFFTNLPTSSASTPFGNPSLFKFGSASSNTAPKQAETKPKEDETPSADSTTTKEPINTPAPTFLSLLNKDQSSTTTTEEQKPKQPEAKSTIFNTFSGFQSSTTSTTSTSMFSSFATSSSQPTSTTLTSAGPNTATPVAPAPFFSFQSGGSKPGLFGSSSFGSAGGDSKNLFGSSTTTAPTPFTGFGAATTTPFSGFGASNGGAEAGGAEAEEEPYEPPKPETSDVKEEGAVFTKRCKMFYFSEKEKKFCDRGIGNLYIKPINNGESTQLIVRADNKLATILLNVKLTKVFPVSKEGAKDVSYVCVPNPELPGVTNKTAPCKFLFKVKTEEDARELLEKMNEYKR